MAKKGPKPAPEPLRRTVTVSSRVSRQEKRIIQATAKARGQTVNEMIYSLAMSASRKAGIFAKSKPPQGGQR